MRMRPRSRPTPKQLGNTDFTLAGSMNVRRRSKTSMRIDTTATQPVFSGLCHQVIGIAGHVIKGPFDDAKAGTPTLPLPGGVVAGFRIKPAGHNIGGFCAPGKEGILGFRPSLHGLTTLSASVSWTASGRVVPAKGNWGSKKSWLNKNE